MRAFDAVFDAQRVFRCVLQATAAPGRLFTLPPTGTVPWEAVALTLLDHEVAFCVVGAGDAGVGDRLATDTGSREVPVREADFAFVLGRSGGEVLELGRGTLERPEAGATAVYAVDRLSNSGPLALRLSGPGVPGERTLGVEGLPVGEVEGIQEARADYPLGVDVYLVDGAGQVAGLPRSTRLEVVF